MTTKEFSNTIIKRRPPSQRKGDILTVDKSTAAVFKNGNGANGHSHDVLDARAELKIAIANVRHLEDELNDLKADLEECKHEVYDFYAKERKRLNKEGGNVFIHEGDVDTEEIRDLRKERRALDREVQEHQKKLQAAQHAAYKAADNVIRAEGHADKLYKQACDLANQLNALLPEIQVCLREVVRRPDDPQHFQTLPANERQFFESLTQFVHNPLSDTFVKVDRTGNTKIIEYANRLTQDPDATL